MILIDSLNFKYRFVKLWLFEIERQRVQHFKDKGKKLLCELLLLLVKKINSNTRWNVTLKTEGCQKEVFQILFKKMKVLIN